MTLRLTRLDKQLRIADPDGTPSLQFLRLYNGTMKAVEDQEASQNAVIQDQAAQLAQILAGLIAQSSTRPTRVLSATEDGADASIVVLEHIRVYADGHTATIPEQTFTGLLTDTPYFPYYVDADRAGSPAEIVMTTDSGEAQLLAGAHSLGRIRTPVAASGTVYEGGGSYMPGATVGREVDGPLP